MVVYYRGPRARITSEHLEVLHPTHRVFALRDLARLRLVEVETEPGAALTFVKSGSSGMAGAAAIAMSLGWASGGRFLDSPVPSVGFLMIVVVSLTALGACWRLRPSRYELIALYRGRSTVLFCSGDLREVGQLARALIRAIQQMEDTR